MKNLNEIDFQKIKNTLVRVDYNVPIGNDFIIQDYTRILRSKKTIEYLLAKNCKILLLTHLGRPDNRYEEAYSIEKIIDQISKLLNQKINFISYQEFNSNGLLKFHETENDISILENIRFFKGEKKNDIHFSLTITNSFDLYINEAFSASHRSHASVDQMARNILSCPGINFFKELEVIDTIKQSSMKTLAIIGGSKVSTKIETLLSLVRSCSNLVIGGAMANNFLKYKNINISDSLIEEKVDDKIFNIIDEAKNNNCQIHLPEDVILDSTEEVQISNISVKNNFKIFDIGSQTISKIQKIIDESELVLWNGPLGIIENKKFSNGSTSIAIYLAKAKSKVIIGGGDTLLALSIANQSFDKYFFVSTAGGAFLEALENKQLPGVDALVTQ
jgi:phosphoglycerate kinase